MQTILIVENNHTHAKLTATLLEKTGYAVLLAGDAEDGMRIARERQPDLILMDIQLPGLNGLAATRQLKDDTVTRVIPVIVLTTFTMEYQEREIHVSGADGFIAKPYYYKKFLDVVKAALPKAV